MRGEEVEQQPIYTTKLKTAEVLLSFFYDALRYDALSKKEVTDWADRMVMHEDTPEYFMIELSLSRDKNELITVLSSVRAPQNDIVARAVLGLLYDRLSDGTFTVAKVVEIMDRYRFPDLLTRVEMDHIYEFTGGFIANEGELTRKVLDFLADYKEFKISTYKYWWSLSHGIRSQFEKKGEALYHAKPAQERKFKMNLWVKYAVVYPLAGILMLMLVSTHSTVSLGKFKIETYHISLLLFTIIASYKL